MSTGGRRIDVVLESFRPRDGVSYDALMLRDALRRLGYRSELFANLASSAPEAKRLARNYRELGSSVRPDAVVYEYSTQSPITAHLCEQRLPVVLRYQNITPPKFFEPFAPDVADRLRVARAELPRLHSVTFATLCPSQFNAEELLPLGFPRGSTMPNFCRWPQGPPTGNAPPTASIRILFVGRLVPNKCQHELVGMASELVAQFRRRVELVLAGSSSDCPTYASLIRSLAQRSPADVRLLGEFPESVPLWQGVHFYVSLSEHEGFGMPLVEAMAAGVPVLAYAAAAVPETVSNGGILFCGKSPLEVAALVESLARSPERWQAVQEAGLARAREFAHENLTACLARALSALGLGGT